VRRFNWVALPTKTRLKRGEAASEQKVDQEKFGKSGVLRNLNSVVEKPPRYKYGGKGTDGNEMCKSEGKVKVNDPRAVICIYSFVRLSLQCEQRYNVIGG